MAFKKQSYSWKKVRPGDIISFSYKSIRKNSQKRLYCILVLNPKIVHVGKEGDNNFHLSGIKLKQNNKPVLRMTKNITRLFETVGKLEAVDFEDDIFRLDINKNLLISEVKGIKQTGFNKLTISKYILNQYRTFDWLTVTKSPVFLEPIQVPRKEDYKTEEIVEEDPIQKDPKTKKELPDDKKNIPTNNKL